MDPLLLQGWSCDVWQKETKIRQQIDGEKDQTQNRGKGNAETETRFYVFIKVASYEYLFSSFFLASFYPRMTMYKTARVKFLTNEILERKKLSFVGRENKRYFFLIYNQISIVKRSILA